MSDVSFGYAMEDETSSRVSAEIFRGRVGLQQRVLPRYRVPFFEALAAVCEGGLGLFVGDPKEGEGITPGKEIHMVQLEYAKNRHIFSPSSPFYVCWQEGITTWLDSWQPDVLILEANPRYLSSYLALRYMHKREKPVLGWGLGAPPLMGFLGSLLRWERNLFLRRFQAMISYSHKGSLEYQRVGFQPQNVYIAPNAVAYRPTNPIPEKRNNANSPVVLFVGRLQERKRVDHLIKACARLPNELQPWLVIVGDGPVRFELETLAAEIYSKTEFLGAVHGAHLESIFNKADLFVLPGTGGLAVQEAMANALPVIVARGDGTQGDLVRPENGWLIPPDDIQALEQALAQALSDLSALRRMGIESYQIVQREINIETMVAVFVEALNSTQ